MTVGVRSHGRLLALGFQGGQRAGTARAYAWPLRLEKALLGNAGTGVNARALPGLLIERSVDKPSLELPAIRARLGITGDTFTRCEGVERCTRFVPA